jgi:hypothetical protein
MPMLRYDYDSVLSRLKERALQKLDGQNILLFSTNAAWLEAVAEEFDDFSLYDEFLTRENIWDTARGTSSIMKQVNYFGYRPHRKIGSTGLIQLSTSKTFDGNWAYNISFPKFTQFSGGGLTFLTKESNFLPMSSQYIDAEVIQGELTKKTIDITQSAFPVPKGAMYARLIVEDADIENSLYEVKVNGEVWAEVDDVRLAVQTPDPAKAKIYSLHSLPDYTGVVIAFGNNMFGKSLAWGDIVEFIYLKTKGNDGNILSAGIVNTVDSAITDETGAEVVLYCRNPSALTGGQGYEVLADIKVNAPRSFQTGNRAISSYDYQSLIRKTGTVDRVMVWGEKEINEDNGDPPGTFVSAAENLIYITGFTVDQPTLTGMTITEANQEIIREFLNDKKGTTDILQFIDTQFIYVDFKPVVWMENNVYTPDQVRDYVHNNLVSAYSINTGIYKKSLYFSDYLRVIDEAAGVDHATCSLSFHETLLFMNAYEFNTDLNIDNIKPNSVSIKIKNDVAKMEWQELAHDDGGGNLIGSRIDPTDPSSDVYVLPSAKIDYSDGSIGDVIVTFGLTEPYNNYDIKIEFELTDAAEGNLILVHRNQMIVYGYDDITTQYMISGRRSADNG